VHGLEASTSGQLLLTRMEEKSGDMSEIEKLLIDSAPMLRVPFKGMPEEVLRFAKFINAVKLYI